MQIKPHFSISIILLILICLQPKLFAKDSSVFEHFITVSGDRLIDGDKEFRFISFNIPNLHCIEDNMAFEETNAWRLPNDYEIADALKSIKMLGGQVTRMYTLTVRRKNDAPEIPRYILGPGQFNEEAFQALDRVLAWANKIGVRIVIPFVDNWSWMGGKAEYAGFRGKEAEAFWTDPQIKEDFKQTIAYVINRTNSVTGIKYQDDKAILAWETGNELKNCPDDWTSEIAAYIKKLDPNHLVIDGYHTSVLRQASVDNPNTDIVTTHHYENDPIDMIEHIRISTEKARGKKPYLVGEFGWLGSKAVEALLDMVISHHEVCGALIWSLRFHNRDGGFYWHSEPAVGGLFKAYHFPGFTSGQSYGETNLIKVMRQKAFTIQGLTVPDLPIPEAPTMLPAEDVAKLSWQGSTSASEYNVERATSKEGPWVVVGRDISDASTAYRPLFHDQSAEIGQSYFYRVRAKNGSGISAPSNIIGPIKVSKQSLVDEMTNYGMMFNKKGKLTLQVENARHFKEDWHRVQGEKGSEIIYYLPGAINNWQIYCFAQDSEGILNVTASEDGQDYHKIKKESKNHFAGAQDYAYLKPLLIHSNRMTGSIKYLRVRFLKKAQISRIEISYGR